MKQPPPPPPPSQDEEASLPTFGIARLALETQLTQPASTQPASTQPPSQPPHAPRQHQHQQQQQQHPFYIRVGEGQQQLGPACGPYLISALCQLPPSRRTEVLSSLQAWASHSSDSKDPHAIKARLEHTLRTSVKMELFPTYSAFHTKDPSWALFRALPFQARALVEYYLSDEMMVATTKSYHVLKELHRVGGLHQAEAILAHFVGKERPEGLAEIFAQQNQQQGRSVVDWGIRLTLDKDSGTGFQAKHLGPIPMRGSSTFMHRALGADRFMRVTFSNRRHWWNARGAQALQVLAQEGIHFAGRRYKYLNHKADSNGLCYFMAEDSMGREGQGFRAYPTHEVVSRLGNFFNFPSIPRLVARVALGFSRSQTLALEPRQIELIDDVLVGDALMTDGSGFIASDLLAGLPSHMFQGRGLPTPFLASSSSSSSSSSDIHAEAGAAAPYAVIQVRLICHLGGWKGTLLVHPQLKGKVQLRRRSMLKFPAPRPSVTPLSRRPTLDVLTTFRVLKATTRLSRELVLILQALEVPQRIFLRLMEEEISSLEGACQDPAQALKLLQRSTTTLLQGSAESQVAEMLRVGHGVEEPYIQHTLRGIRSRAMAKLQQGRVLCPSSLYIVGQPDPLGVLKPNEVFVCHGLPHDYPGLPDDNDSSENGVYEGPVLIARHPIHNPAHMQAFEAVRQDALHAFLGPRQGVLFFSIQGPRSPASLLSNGDMDGDVYFVCLHKDIVASACPITSVDKESDSSTSSSSAPSSSSSTAPLEAPSASPPCPGSEMLTNVGPFRFNKEPVGYQIDSSVMRRCLESCLAQAKAGDIVASACDWWVRHADVRGAKSTNCVILGEIGARALDSAKTGELWSLPTVLKPSHRPAYLSRGKSSPSASASSSSSSSSSVSTKPTITTAAALLGYERSSSLLGTIHSRVSAALADDVGGRRPRGGGVFSSAATTGTALRLDPDLRVEGASAFLQQASGWVKAYRQSLAWRMKRRCFAQQQQNQDDPGDYQALKEELLAPYRRAFSDATVVKVGKEDSSAAVEAAEGRHPLQPLSVNGAQSSAEAKEAEATTAKKKETANKDIEKQRRLALASAIYEVTYMHGTTLSFAWDLCLPELNHVKKMALGRREKQASAVSK